MSFRRILESSCAVVLASTPALAKPYRTPHEVRRVDPYRTVLDATVGMVSDPEAQRLASARGLQILNVTWEDTGRYKDSAVGPNISDMTLQVAHDGPHGQELFLMPVIRFPNFEDRSADLRLDRFHLLVGNEDGKSLRKVSLKDLLSNLPAYLHDPSSWTAPKTSLLAPRDTHALVSAQAAFLPIPAAGEATFNPVLFNYQSVAGDPAVLTILATREGTSITIIDNERDGFSARGMWGQRLFFNKDGERASLTGKRLSDWKLDPDSAPSTPGTVVNDAGLNMVLLIQVPLRQKPRRREDGYTLNQLAPSPSAGASGMVEKSDVENAVIGHGEVEGPFTEIDGLSIARDTRFPVRVTVQFYKATSNGVVSKADLDAIKAQIDRVYADGDYVGSLVTEGDTRRPTEHDGPKVEPADWWPAFYRHQGWEWGW